MYAVFTILQNSKYIKEWELEFLFKNKILNKSEDFSLLRLSVSESTGDHETQKNIAKHNLYQKF